MIKRGCGAVVVVVAVALSGCGGSSSSDQTTKFKQSFTTVANQFQQTAHSIALAIQNAPGQSDAQLGSAFHGFATSWQGALSQLETLKPPANVQTQFNTLTSAGMRTEADLTAIVSAAETHAAGPAKQASASLITDILSAKAAATAITKKLGTT